MALGEFEGDISPGVSTSPSALDLLSAMEWLNHLTQEVASMMFKKVG